LRQVGRQPTIRAELESVNFTKEISTSTSVNDLTSQKATSGAPLIHWEITLDLVDDHVMSIT
jgi:hypothetical protein